MFIVGGFSVALLFKNPSLAKGLRDFTLNTIKSKTKNKLPKIPKKPKHLNIEMKTKYVSQFDIDQPQIEYKKELTNPNYYQPDFVYIFCDGSSIQDINYKSIRCGYGVYVVKQNGESISLPTLIDKSTVGTNNIAELSAILDGLKIIKKYQLKKVIFISDSIYAINSITVWCNNWKKNNWQTSNKKPIENLEIIKEAVETHDYLKYNGYEIIFKHIKSHMKQPDNLSSYEYFLWHGNDVTDQLAKYGEIKKVNPKPVIFNETK